MSVETVKGQTVTIRFDAARCVHARNCVLSHPNVYVPNVKGDWLHPDAATPEAVIRTGRRNVVIVAQAAGRYAPVEVALGRESGDSVEITRGHGQGVAGAEHGHRQQTGGLAHRGGSRSAARTAAEGRRHRATGAAILRETS
mgnify:CR=1 FL=1